MSHPRLMVFSGNPGSSQDFEPLLAALNLKDSKAVAPVELRNAKANMPDLLATIDKALPKQHTGPLLAICYSFGSYAALQWAYQYHKTFDRLILISPTLRAGEPISSLKRLLVSAPFVGSLILSKAAPKLAYDFIEKSFAPETVKPALQSSLFQQLNQQAIWKKAMDLKVLQQENPLTEKLTTCVKRLCIIRGGADQSVSWEAQEEGLTRCSLLDKRSDHQTAIHAIPNAGHALLWSRIPELVTIIRPEIEGYGL